jgi:hypothetical protein
VSHPERSFGALITVENTVGRLHEVRFVMPVSLDDITMLASELSRSMAKGKIIAVSDLRGCGVLPPEVFEALLRMVRIDNRGIERSAVLLPPHAISQMQFERLVREAGNPARRTFRDVPTLCAWLAETLTATEQHALRRFLG